MEGTEALPVDLASNAESLGAKVYRCESLSEFEEAIGSSRSDSGPVVLYVRNDRYVDVPGYDSWWDVPPAEVSTSAAVQEARADWEDKRKAERLYL